jgi:hypothetical protein
MAVTEPPLDKSSANNAGFVWSQMENTIQDLNFCAEGREPLEGLKAWVAIHLGETVCAAFNFFG